MCVGIEIKEVDEASLHYGSSNCCSETKQDSWYCEEGVVAHSKESKQSQSTMNVDGRYSFIVQQT